MSSSVLYTVGPASYAFSLLGWLPFGGKQPALQEADYSSKKPAESPVPEARLKDVQVFFRHGARTPVTPTDQYWKGTNWDVCGDKLEALAKSLRNRCQNSLPIPKLSVFQDVTEEPVEECIDQSWQEKIMKGGCSKGELTKLGQDQAVSLGKWLRHRYTGASAPLAETYSKEMVTAHTTNYRRTRGTMHGVLLGLFPGCSEDFEVTTSLHDHEMMLFQVASCEKLKTWYYSNKKRMQASDIVDPELVAAEKQIRGVLGYDKDPENPEGRIHFGELHDCLTSMRAHKKSIHAGLSSLDLDLIDRLATARMSGYLGLNGDIEALKLGAGRLVSVVAERMHAATAAEQPKISLWCGHDTTIMPLLTVLGNGVSRWPPYASSLVLELWEDTSVATRDLPVEQRHYVRVLFNGQELNVRSQPPQGGEASGTENKDGVQSGKRLPNPVTWQQFHDEVLAVFALSEKDRKLKCQVHQSLLDRLLGTGGSYEGGKVDTSKY